jgi:hypothetical protein
MIVWITLGFPLCGQQPLPGAAGWKGVLRNAAGNPLSGATIELIGASGHKAVSVTKPDGTFLFSQLPPSLFTLFVTVASHRIAYPQPVTLETSDVILTLSSEGTLALQAAPAEKETAAGVVLSSQSVSQLPLNKRDFSQLLLLAAGTMTDANGATNFTQQFAINGQRGVEATFAMDGADISDPEMGGSGASAKVVLAIRADAKVGGIAVQAHLAPRFEGMTGRGKGNILAQWITLHCLFRRAADGCRNHRRRSP